MLLSPRRALCGISPGFPRLFPTKRHITYALLTRAPLGLLPARLACVRPAASVRSEPGSNSPVLYPGPRFVAKRSIRLKLYLNFRNCYQFFKDRAGPRRCEAGCPEPREVIVGGGRRQILLSTSARFEVLRMFSVVPRVVNYPLPPCSGVAPQAQPLWPGVRRASRPMVRLISPARPRRWRRCTLDRRHP